MRHHENWIKSYLNYTRLLESPDGYHLWTAIGTIAGAMRGKCWFDMGHFRWSPNFFIIFVGPPGVVSKSTSMGVGMRLLKELGKEIHIGPNSITWQAIVEALADASMTFQLDDAGTLQNYSCVTFFASELGSLLNMSDKGMVDALTDLWDGNLSTNVWSRRTLSRGKTTIENPWIHIMACTTPGWIADSVPKRSIAGGFISRCVFVFADEKRRLSAYPKLEGKLLNIDTETEKITLVEDLRDIAGLVGEFILDTAAQEFGETWYLQHYKNNKNAEADMSGYMARKQAHMHKIAMVISAAQRSTRVITQDDMETALAFLESAEAAMPMVFSGIHASGDMSKAQRILEFVQGLKTQQILKTALYRRFMPEMSMRDFTEFIESLVQAGHLGLRQNNEQFVIYATRKEKNDVTRGTTGDSTVDSEAGAGAPPTDGRNT